MKLSLVHWNPPGLRWPRCACDRELWRVSSDYFVTRDQSAVTCRRCLAAVARAVKAAL